MLIVVQHEIFRELLQAAAPDAALHSQACPIDCVTEQVGRLIANRGYFGDYTLRVSVLVATLLDHRLAIKRSEERVCLAPDLVETPIPRLRGIAQMPHD